jgi:glycosyltransferase involved in cell wall biosynthesis
MRLSVLSVAYPLAPVGPDAAGGSEQILSMLDRALVRGGHRSVVVACEGSVTEGTLISIPAQAGELNWHVHTRAQDDERRAIQQALGAWHFDLIHMHSLDFHYYLPPPGVPVVVTLHLPPDWYPKEIFSIARPDTWLHCVSASQQSACPPSGILLPYISNGVPADRLCTKVSKRKFAVAIGRICPEKGYHRALDAAERAGVPLLLAGQVFRYREHESYFFTEILPRMNGNGHRFVGHVNVARKRRLLAAARCLLVPSLVPETSSLVAMEALACGTPVVAFPAGALGEVIEHGRTGFLVNDEKEMADAIAAVDAIDPEECRRAARERFSAHRMVQDYFSLYRRLARPEAHVAEVIGHRS